MGNQSNSADLGGLQRIAILVFVFLCGVPALQLAGFGVGIPLTLKTALVCATVGGALGGFLFCPRPALAGLVGGLIAGPVGLLAVYHYAEGAGTGLGLGVGCRARDRQPSRLHRRHPYSGGDNGLSDR